MAVFQTQKIDYVCDLCGRTETRAFEIPIGGEFVHAPTPVEMGFAEVPHVNGGVSLFCGSHIIIELTNDR